MRYLPAILIGHLIRFAVRLVRPGGGSALPGLVVSKLAPSLVYKTLESFPRGYVCITGTAGKSTTTKMVVAIVRAHGLEVFTNPSTANIEQGFFSTIVRTGNLMGKVPGEVAILEMDEAHAAKVAKRVKPTTSTILNVLEDQLDRFIDPAKVRETLTEVAKATKGTVLLNADDQNCLLIAKAMESSNTSWFGFSKEIAEESDLKYAPTYLSSLDKPAIETELLKLNEKSVTVMISEKTVEFDLPNRGAHFALDAIAALATAKELLGEVFDSELSAKVLNELPPVFSRGEIREVNGEPVEFVLVQNPASMQLNLDNLSSNLDEVLFAIGRDVHDPSWLWTVDYSNLKHVSVVTGFNFADAALVLKYSGVEVDVIESDYFKAIDDFFQMPKPVSGIKTVVYSADAMRRLRRYKGFTDPEDVARG